MPIQTIDIAPDISGVYRAHHHRHATVLFRIGDHTAGYARVPCHDGVIHTGDIRIAMESDDEFKRRYMQEAILRWLMRNGASGPVSLPPWSVVVYGHRADDIARCLDSLMNAPVPGGEIIVVDRSPTDAPIESFLKNYPVRYIREDSAGLGQAILSAVKAAKGDAIIFTSDNGSIDMGWVSAILEPLSSPMVVASVGLTMPTEPGEEAEGSFSEHHYTADCFQRRTLDHCAIAPALGCLIADGINMAIRREHVERIFALRHEAKGVEMKWSPAHILYQLLSEGYRIVYTPDAVLWLENGRDAAVEYSMAGYCLSALTFFIGCFFRYGDMQALIRAALLMRQLAISALFWPKYIRSDIAKALFCPLYMRVLLSGRNKRYLRGIFSHMNKLGGWMQE